MFNYTETHNLLVSLLGNAPYGILTTDTEGYISIINQQCLTNLNIEQLPSDVLETSILSIVKEIPDLSKAIRENLSKYPKPFDLLGIAHKGRYLNIKSRNISRGMMITIEDVTAAKEMESVQAMLRGQENERKRLASEIHDGVGASLSTLNLNLESILPEIEKKAPAIKQNFEQIIATSKTINKELRQISHSLMPGALIDFGLTTAIEMLVKRIKKTQVVDIQFYVRNMEERLQMDIELALYRITQELVNNALKYAEADQIQVQLIKYESSVLLMVEDDGKGFDQKKLEKKKDKGIGFRNVGIRARSIGGVLNIDTHPDQGVSVTIDVPLP